MTNDTLAVDSKVSRCGTSTSTAAPAPDKDVCSSVTELVSFAGHEHLLRGVRLASIMRGGGRIFANSHGSELTYLLSERVEAIGYFISHNWVVFRPLKYLALAFKFNMDLALAAGFITLITGTVFGMLGIMPTIESEKFEYPIGFVTRIIIIPVVMFALFFGGSLLSFLKLRTDPIMFLDKVCIHQVDKELQAAGIKKLGAFLRVSDRMLVLLSGIYLKKLWTVYEVASFLSVHDVSKLEVVPLALPVCFALFVSLMFSYQFFMIIVHVANLPEWVVWIVNAFGSCIYMCCLRVWARTKVDIEDTIRNFSVHHATCAVESDRAIVYQNIAALQKSSGRVRRSATLEESLEAFDMQVRTTLLAQFTKVFGRLSFTHSEYIVISFACSFALHADYWAGVGAGQPWREAIGQRCMDPFLDWIVLPGWAILIELVCGLYISCSMGSWKDITYIFSVNLFVSAVGSAMQELQKYWGARAKDDDLWLYAGIALQVVLISASFPFFRRFGSLHRERIPITGFTLGTEGKSSTDAEGLGTCEATSFVEGYSGPHGLGPKSEPDASPFALPSNLSDEIDFVVRADTQHRSAV